MSRKYGEKKIDVFNIGVDQDSFEVPVYRQKDVDRYSERVTFRAEYEAADLSIEDTDINKLRAAVKEHLEKWHRTDWKLLLRVDASVRGCQWGRRRSDANDVELGFKYGFVAVGARADGNVVHREVGEENVLVRKVKLRGKNIFGEDTEMRELKPDEPWDGEWDAEGISSTIMPGEPKTCDPEKGRREYGDGLEATVYIPATIENVETARRIARTLRSMGEEMVKRFGPKRIDETLAQIKAGAQLLLPASTEERR